MADVTQGEHTARLPGMPSVAYAPGDYSNGFDFLLAVAGHHFRMRKADLQALYRDCDAALNDERRAADRG